MYLINIIVNVTSSYVYLSLEKKSRLATFKIASKDEEKLQNMCQNIAFIRSSLFYFVISYSLIIAFQYFFSYITSDNLLILIIFIH